MNIQRLHIFLDGAIDNLRLAQEELLTWKVKPFMCLRIEKELLHGIEVCLQIQDLSNLIKQKGVTE